jgi:uncharacterized membrane protein YcaP (DUF421 family)
VNEIWEVIERTLGLGREALELTWWQMALRAVLVYVAALLLIRSGEKRMLGKSTAFDVILGIMIGSVISRAINSGAPFFETLLAGAVLVGLHYLFAIIAFRSDTLGTLFKGSPRRLIHDGEIQWDAMRKSNIGEHDLVSALRSEASIEDPREVKAAYLERSGEISVIKMDREPRVVEVAMRDGVQTVLIEIQT